MTKLAIIRLPHAQDLPIPKYETEQSAGFDLSAACPQSTPVVLKTGKRILIPTGFIFEVPKNHEGQIRPRSGLAYKFGITCLNTPGTIDSDYRGEVSVLLINHGQEPFTIERGMRIAQMVIAPIVQVEFDLREKTNTTLRGSGGFGSTGI